MSPLVRQSDVDACPGALRLHAAADGPLARVRVPGGELTGDRLRVLGDLAVRWGDGHLELTSRANVQLRALTGADPQALATLLATAGLLPSTTHEVVRNIAAPPLADDRLRALVHALDQALCADPALAALPGRFLFAIGTVPLAADVAAVPTADGFAILLAGADPGLRVPRSGVVSALLAAAHAFLSLRGESPGGESPGGGAAAWRLAELADGPARVAGALGVPLGAAAPIEQIDPEPPIGVLPQPGGRAAAGAMVPLGRLTAAQVTLLARADRVVVTPWRGVVLPDLAPAAAAEWAAALAEAGLPVVAESRWAGVTACAGRPGCAKSLADVRAEADAATTGFVAGRPVHWLGCARGCGSPTADHVRVEATAAGWAVDGVPAAADRLAGIVAEARRR